MNRIENNTRKNKSLTMLSAHNNPNFFISMSYSLKLIFKNIEKLDITE